MKPTSPLLRTVFASVLSASSIHVAADTLYFTDPGFADSVGEIPTDGSGLTEYFGLRNSDPRGLAIDSVARKVYFARGASIYRGNLDGTGLTFLVAANDGAPSGVPHDVEIDRVAGKLYWSLDSSGAGGGIRSANLDGSGYTVLLSQAMLDATLGVDPLVRADSVSGIEMQGGRIYWGNSSALNSIPTSGFSAAADAVNQFTLGSGEVNGIAIDPVAAQVYFTSTVTSEVMRATLTGGDLTTLVNRGFGHPGPIAIDTANDVLYYGDSLGPSGRGQILKADLGGDDSPDVILDRGSTAFAPADLELVSAVPEPQTWAMFALGLGLIFTLLWRKRA